MKCVSYGERKLSILSSHINKPALESQTVVTARLQSCQGTICSQTQHNGLEKHQFCIRTAVGSLQ